MRTNLGLRSILIASAALTCTLAHAQTQSDSLWSDAATPAIAAASDVHSVEVGVKFSSDVNGLITAIRFYKGAQNTGEHVVSLWSSDQEQLASATSTNETASGWQTVILSTPVTVVAGTTYVASLHTPGRYAYDSEYFSTAYSAGVLHAPAGAGVYTYAAGSTFPASQWQDDNYWIDVVFEPTASDPLVNGQCGSSNGANLVSAPTTNFCAAGTASSITGNGPWQWTCAGSGGGTTAYCQAFAQQGPTAYVTPGTQGFQGSPASLPVYSAANGKIPPGTSCSWNQTGLYLECDDTNLTFDSVYIQGGVYARGCGNITVTNSIIDQQPGTGWTPPIADHCTTWDGKSTITVRNSTLRTGPPTGGTPPNQTYPVYLGQQDNAPVWQYTGMFPELLYNNVLAGFPQGVTGMGSNSIIENNEIYTQVTWCVDSDGTGLWCHGDGVYNEGSNNVLVQGNVVVTPIGYTTGAYFSQNRDGPNMTGDTLQGNLFIGGEYTIYNESDTGINVINNTFGGYDSSNSGGDCIAWSGASWGTWTGNVHTDGTPVTPSGSGCN